MIKISDKKLITGLVILGAVIIFSSVFFREKFLGFFVGAAYDLFMKPPERTFCLNTGDDYRCITDRAIEEKDVSTCYFLDAGNGDRCIDEVVFSGKDASICKNIRQTEYRVFCLKRFDI